MFLATILAISTAVGVALAGPTHGKHVICSVLTKSLQDSANIEFDVDKFDFNLCTHLVALDQYWYNNEDPWKTSNPNASDYAQLTSLRQRFPHLKVLLGVRRDGFDYATISGNDKMCEKYASVAANFTAQFDFDGIELHFYSNEFGVFQSPAVRLVEELSQKLKETKRILIGSYQVGEHNLEDQGVDYVWLSRSYEFISFQHLYLNSTTDKAIQLRTVSSLKNHVDNLIKKEMPANKIVVDFPYISPEFNKTLSNGEIKFNRVIFFSRVCTLLSNNDLKWERSFDNETDMATASTSDIQQGRENIEIFENSRAIANKVRAVLKQKVGGIKTGILYTDDGQGLCGFEPDTWNDFKPSFTGVTIHIPKRNETNFALTRTINEAIEVTLDEIRQEPSKPSHSVHNTVGVLVLMSGIFAYLLI